MRANVALSDFLLPELLALLSDTPPVDVYASEESESQSQSQSQAHGAASTTRQHQPRVVMVHSTRPSEQTVTFIDRNFSATAFLPQHVIAAQVLEKCKYKSLSSLRGSYIRIEKYHFSTPQRYTTAEKTAAAAASAKQSRSLASTRQAPPRICLWVDELSVVDVGEFAVNSMPAICESVRIRSHLDELSDAELDTRLIVRQGLPQKPLAAIVEHFDDSHPLEDEDCIIPEDQEAQLDAQDGWGVPAQKQKSDSQLIAENGSEPESQDVESQLSLGAVPVRVEPTDQSQDARDDGDDESVPDSQGFHFQHENIEATFVQCSDTESEEESSVNTSVHTNHGNAAATTASSQVVGVSSTAAVEVTAQTVVALSTSPASTPKRKRLKVKRKRDRLSQQSTQSNADLPRDAEELIYDAAIQQLSAGKSAQVVDPFSETEDASGCISIHTTESQDGPLTQAPGDYSMLAATQDEPNTPNAEAGDESSQAGSSGSFGAIDDDMWHTQPNEDSQAFGFASQSQSEREPGSRLQSIQSFIDVEAPQSLLRIAEASENTEEPEFGAGDSFAGGEENRRVPGNESQPDSDDFQQSENLLSPKVARKQVDSESVHQQPDQLAEEPRLSPEATSPARSNPPTQPEAVDLISPVHNDKALLALAGQKRNQKRPLGSVIPDHPHGSLPVEAEEVASLHSSKHRKALRRTDNLSPHQSSNREISGSTAMRIGHGYAHYQGVPLSIQQRALQLLDDPQVSTNGDTSSDDVSMGEPKSLLTLLNQLQHREATQQSTSSLSSRRRINALSAHAVIPTDIRPSKRYEHLFPPLRMDDLDTMILERFSKSK